MNFTQTTKVQNHKEIIINVISIVLLATNIVIYQDLQIINEFTEDLIGRNRKKQFKYN